MKKKKLQPGTYGNMLKAARTRQGVTIESAAGTVGIHKMSWWKLEQDMREPRATTAMQIYQNFGVTHNAIKNLIRGAK